MPNGDPQDRFFYPTLTLMIDSYSLAERKLIFFLIHQFNRGFSVLKRIVLFRRFF